MEFLGDLILNFNQLTKAVLQRMTNLTLAALLTIRGQIGYNDDTDKIVYNDGTTVQTVATEEFVETQVTASGLTVNPNSTSFVSIDNGQLEVKPLLVTRPVIDTFGSTSLEDALLARTPIYDPTNVGNDQADLQSGDTLIIPSHTDGLRAYLHNGGTRGTTADFTLVEKGSISEAAIKALLSGANGLNYDALGGVMKLGGEINEDTSISLNPFAGAFSMKDAGNDLDFSMSNYGSKLLRLLFKGAGLTMYDNIVALSSPAGDTSEFLFQDRRTAPNKRGIQVNFTDYSALVASSLTPKGYVDNKIDSSKANVTVDTIGGVWTSVPHNFDLPVGSEDFLIVSIFNSAGAGVFAPFRKKDKDNIEIFTSQSEIGLRVRMFKTL
jgi:hypothetical protein